MGGHVHNTRTLESKKMLPLQKCLCFKNPGVNTGAALILNRIALLSVATVYVPLTILLLLNLPLHTIGMLAWNSRES